MWLSPGKLALTHTIGEAQFTRKRWVFKSLHTQSPSWFGSHSFILGYIQPLSPLKRKWDWRIMRRPLTVSHLPATPVISNYRSLLELGTRSSKITKQLENVWEGDPTCLAHRTWESQRQAFNKHSLLPPPNEVSKKIAVPWWFLHFSWFPYMKELFKVHSFLLIGHSLNSNNK